jgi:hypothetical protein
MGASDFSIITINTESFRRYWLEKLRQIEKNDANRSEFECLRIKKRILSSLSVLHEIDERSNVVKNVKSGNC